MAPAVHPHQVGAVQDWLLGFFLEGTWQLLDPWGLLWAKWS
jgi:hypothetical protein